MMHVPHVMQRKRNSSAAPPTPAPTPRRNDDAAAKAKGAPSLLPPGRMASIRTARGQAADLASSYCLPGVPVALKLTLLSFVGFAALVVLTAKGRHAHWRFRHVRGPLMPEPSLHGKIARDMARSAAERRDGGEDAPGPHASSRMRDTPSRFVDSEKALKRQLQRLLDLQNQEKRGKRKAGDGTVLGVKIANRYLGEDMLPYPLSKGDEKEWEMKMERRKADLKRQDAQEWDAMMREYDEVMADHVEMNERVDHELGADEGGPRHASPPGGGGGGDAGGDGGPILPPPGSARWPSPSRKAGDGTTILLEPAFGSHRPGSNAVLAFAEGYDLSIYLAFVESLRATDYDGDVVFSISVESRLRPGVRDYLRSVRPGPDGRGINVVAYEVEWTCFTQKGEPADGSREGMHPCRMDGAFGGGRGGAEAVDDPREPRPVATARYELYWIWSLRYRRTSWLMLIDARDVWFQLDPFAELMERGDVNGELHLFGENADAVRIGTSDYNRKWLTTAYGRKAIEPFLEEPVICSGSTIGNQDAIETYLRAMVAEYDATLCKQKGCDQGFHNYLYYSKKLDPAGGGAEGISSLTVHEQGRGIINNLGALRTKPLREWGMYDPERALVLNWDGSTSRVAHQMDRDKEVNAMIKLRKKEFEQKLKT